MMILPSGASLYVWPLVLVSHGVANRWLRSLASTKDSNIGPHLVCDSRGRTDPGVLNALHTSVTNLALAQTLHPCNCLCLAIGTVMVGRSPILNLRSGNSLGRLINAFWLPGCGGSRKGPYCKEIQCAFANTFSNPPGQWSQDPGFPLLLWFQSSLRLLCILDVKFDLPCAYLWFSGHLLISDVCIRGPSAVRVRPSPLQK